MSFRGLTVFTFAVMVAAIFVAAPARAQENSAADSSAHPDASSYMLGPGDVLDIVVYDEKDLSNHYRVDEAGVISVPLIGEVRVGGLSPREAERLITDKLADGYLVKPSVSIQIAEARPFYILGEVKNPGSYKYVSDMTVLNAVALAGGFTYRADEDDVKIVRGEKKLEVPPETKILPGDVVTVDERFF